MAKSLTLICGKKVLIDKEDFDRAKKLKWRKTVVHGNATVTTKIAGSTITLPRFIYSEKIDEDEIVCFASEDRLDFRKSNLVKTSKKNHTSRGKGWTKSTSRYKGVHWSKEKSAWVASISINRRTKYLGAFKSEDEAAESYNNAVKKYRSEPFQLNRIGASNIKEPITQEKFRVRNPTGFRGVSKNGINFRATISKSSKKHHLGTFTSPEEAAKAYDRKAFEFYGNRARLNFPEDVGKARN